MAINRSNDRILCESFTEDVMEILCDFAENKRREDMTLQKIIKRALLLNKQLEETK